MGSPLVTRKGPRSVWWPGDWFSHNINELANLAGVPMDAGTYALFNIMTAATEWVGKYPLAKYEKQYKDHSAQLVFITKRSVLPYRISEVLHAYWDDLHEGAIGTTGITPTP